MIFHIRATDRTTPDGKKVLYIEELQSDWAQRGRKTQRTEGFNLKGEERTKVENRIKELEDNLSKKDDKEVKRVLEKSAIYIKRKRYNKVKNTDDMILELKEWSKHNKGFNLEDTEWKGIPPDEFKILDDYLDNWHRDTEEFSRLNKKLASDIPEGPFVGATDKWTALAIKRLIAKAQKEGYSQISFSPGEVQSGRWGNDEGLAKYYDEIIPKVAKKITNKMDNVSVGSTDVKIDKTLSQERSPTGLLLEKPPEKRFTIKLSPDKEFEGFPYMSLAPISAAPIVESLRQEQPIY